MRAAGQEGNRVATERTQATTRLNLAFIPKSDVSNATGVHMTELGLTKLGLEDGIDPMQGKGK